MHQSLVVCHLLRQQSLTFTSTVGVVVAIVVVIVVPVAVVVIVDVVLIAVVSQCIPTTALVHEAFGGLRIMLPLLLPPSIAQHTKVGVTNIKTGCEHSTNNNNDKNNKKNKTNSN